MSRVVLALVLVVMLSGCVAPEPALLDPIQSREGDPVERAFAMAMTFGFPIAFCVDILLLIVAAFNDGDPEPFIATKGLADLMRELWRGRF